MKNYVSKTFFSRRVWWIARRFASNSTGFDMHPVTRRALPGPVQQRSIDEQSLRQFISPELRLLAGAFALRGLELRIVGGGVRDFVLGREPLDLDLATNASPSEIRNIVRSNDRMVFGKSPGGRLGSFKVLVDSAKEFDVTSLRMDVKTNGRSAEVEFVRDWSIDAARRDFTCNALYLSLEGTLTDFFNGESDLLRGEVVFIGEPEVRIREDFLRILRYFRFRAIVAGDNEVHHPSVLDAISANAFGLSLLPPQRLWTEMKRLLTTSPSCAVFAQMIPLGVLPHLSLPDSEADLARMSAAAARARSFSPDPVTNLASLFPDLSRAKRFVAAMGLKRSEEELLIFLVRNRKLIEEEADLAETKRILFRSISAQPDQDVKGWATELAKLSGNEDFVRNLEEFYLEAFPLSMSDLRKLDVDQPVKKRLLRELSTMWVKSGRRISKEDLWKMGISKTKRERLKKYAKGRSDGGRGDF